MTPKEKELTRRIMLTLMTIIGNLTAMAFVLVSTMG